MSCVALALALAAVSYAQEQRMDAKLAAGVRIPVTECLFCGVGSADIDRYANASTSASLGHGLSYG